MENKLTTTFKFESNINKNSSDLKLTFKDQWEHYFGELDADTFKTLQQLSFLRSRGIYSSRKFILKVDERYPDSYGWRCRCIGENLEEGTSISEHYEAFLGTHLNCGIHYDDLKTLLIVDNTAKKIFSYNKYAMARVSQILTILQDELIEANKSDLTAGKLNPSMPDGMLNWYTTYTQNETLIDKQFLKSLRETIESIIPKELENRKFKINQIDPIRVSVEFSSNFFGVRDISAILRGRVIDQCMLSRTFVTQRVITIDLQQAH